MKTVADLNGWVGNINDRLSGNRALTTIWFTQFGHNCQSCGVQMTRRRNKKNKPTFATIDHIVARGIGGDDSPENLQVICRKCNGEKSVEESRASPRGDYRPAIPTQR